MKSHFIQDLLQMPPGQTFQSIFRLKSPKMLPKKNGDLYLQLLLADATGELEAKLWHGDEAHCEQAKQTPYALVSGKVDSYDGKRQAIIHAFSDWQYCPKEVSLYEAVAPLPLNELQARLNAHIASLQSAHLKALINGVFGDNAFRRRFDCWPAAKRMHHACRHGLLQHTLEVTDLAAAMADAQRSWGYAPLSRDLVIVGALLHDVGKVYEIEAVGGDYAISQDGELLGHILIGQQWVSKKISQIAGFPAELRTAILHIIDSHHGKPEYGSPIPPKFVEAQIVQMADLLDTQMFYFQEAAQTATEETVKVWGLDNRRVLTRSWHDFLMVAKETSESTPLSPVLHEAGLPTLRFRTAPAHAGDNLTFRTVRLPLIGRAAAGMPQFAEQHIEDYVDVEEEGLKAGDHYLLQVEGESMIGDGIQDGDRVVVHRQTHHAPEDIVVVFFDDRNEAAIKRIHQTNDQALELRSSNPAFAPIPVSDTSTLRLCGRVIGILRN